MSLRQLAEKSGNIISAQAISNYERGASTPSPEVLQVLATALGVSENYLTLENNEISESSVSFLMQGTLDPHETSRVSASILQHLENYLRVENALDLPSVTWDRPWQAPWPVRREPAEAEHAARELRSLWRMGLKPVANLAELLEEHGIKLLPMRLSRSNGLMARVQRENDAPSFVVVVNNQHWSDQQRFTMARELSRLVLDISPKIASEAAAASFAGAFLMPREALRAEVGKYRISIHWKELLALRRKFGVSVQDIIARCTELEIFSQALAQKLFSEFKQRGQFHKEPHPLARERSERFYRLCWRAFEEQAIGLPEAAMLLKKSLPEFIHLESEFPDYHAIATAHQSPNPGKPDLESLRRDHIAKRIARKYNGEYQKDHGLDIITPDRVIAVETLATVPDGFQRLRNYSCPAYVAGIDHESTNTIMNWLRHTNIGVMNPMGDILKPSGRSHQEAKLSSGTRHTSAGRSPSQRGRRRKAQKTTPPVLFLPVQEEEYWKDYFRGFLRFNTSEDIQTVSGLTREAPLEAVFSHRNHDQRQTNSSRTKRRVQNPPTYIMRFTSNIRIARENNPRADVVLIVEQPMKLKERIEARILNIPDRHLIDVKWQRVMLGGDMEGQSRLDSRQQRFPRYLREQKDPAGLEEWQLLIAFQRGLPILNDTLELGIGDCRDIFSIARKPGAIPPKISTD